MPGRSGWSTVYLGMLAWALRILATAALLAARSGRAVVVPHGPAMVTGTLIAVLQSVQVERSPVGRGSGHGRTRRHVLRERRAGRSG